MDIISSNASPLGALTTHVLECVMSPHRTPQRFAVLQYVWDFFYRLISTDPPLRLQILSLAITNHYVVRLLHFSFQLLTFQL